MENGPFIEFIEDLAIKRQIFRSYVSLPEGIYPGDVFAITRKANKSPQVDIDLGEAGVGAAQ